MNTKVLRIDLLTSSDIAADITSMCESLYPDSWKLRSTFVWGNNLVLIFQKGA